MVKPALKRSKNKYSEVTKMALEYKTTKNQKLLLELQKKTDKLVKYMLYKGHIQSSFGKEAFEEVYYDCRSIILLRAIDRFKKDKNTQFSSYYGMWLRSYIKAKKGVYARREKVYNTLSLDYKTDFDDKLDGHALNTKYDTNSFVRYKARVQDNIFNPKKEMFNEISL